MMQQDSSSFFFFFPCPDSLEEGAGALGSFSSTYLHAAFTPGDPERVKRQSSHHCLFALIESVCPKAACKTLVKLTPGRSGLYRGRSSFFTDRGELPLKTGLHVLNRHSKEMIKPHILKSNKSIIFMKVKFLLW